MLDSRTTKEERPAPFPFTSHSHEEETLVTDPRAGLTPAQLVERKLLTMLQKSPLLISRLQTARTVRR